MKNVLLSLLNVKICFLGLSLFIFEADALDVKNLVFEYKDEKVVLRGPGDVNKLVELKLYPERGYLKLYSKSEMPFKPQKLPLPPKLCRINVTDFEKWTYHRNSDGTFGLIGEHVNNILGNQLYIDQFSSVCGFTTLSGNVRIENSYVQGGPEQEKRLVIKGDSGVQSKLLFIKNSKITANGKILGNVYINSVSEKQISGFIDIDSCVYQNGILVFDEERTFSCDNTPVALPDDSQRINIWNSSILGPKVRIHHYSQVLESTIKGNVLIGEGETWDRSPSFSVVQMDLYPNDCDDCMSEFTGDVNIFDSKIKGKTKIAGTGVTPSLLYFADIDGENDISGEMTINHTTFRVKNTLRGYGEFYGSDTKKIMLEGNDFRGRYYLNNTSSKNNTIQNSGYPYTVQLVDMAHLGEHNLLMGKVTTYIDSTIGNNVVIDGQIATSDISCENCNIGVILGTGTTVDGDGTVLSGWLDVQNSNILSGSKVYVTSETVNNRYSQIFDSTLINETFLSGSISADNVTLDHYVASGKIICDAELGCRSSKSENLADDNFHENNILSIDNFKQLELH